MATNQNAEALYGFLKATTASPGSSDHIIGRALQTIRAHLGMDVAFMAQIVGDTIVLREFDAPGHEDVAVPGDKTALEPSFCSEILRGRLPNVINDVAADPIARNLPVAVKFKVGSYIGVPIMLGNGEPFGLLSCLSFHPDPTLNERDLQTVKAFADLVAFEIDREVRTHETDRAAVDRIRRTIAKRAFSTVYQPIWDLTANRPVGVECLTRFDDAEGRSPATWFVEAAESGLATDLELSVTHQALQTLPQWPDFVQLAINASPQTIVDSRFSGLLDAVPPDRIILEVTEHAVVSDYPGLLKALAPLREHGVRLAVDDAGAGYSGLQHILQLRPDYIKLDMSLTRHIDVDRARRALTTALVHFGEDTGCALIAEGVETAEELKTLVSLGVGYAQGYLLGRPLDMGDAQRLFTDGGLRMPGNISV